MSTQKSIASNHVVYEDNVLVKENDTNYFATDALSNSRLSQILKCPLLYKVNLPITSKSMELGSLFHAMVLEPETLNERFQEKLDLRTREGKAQAKRANEGEVTLVTSSDWETARAMSASLTRNTIWERMVSAGFDAEISVYSTYRGLDVKGRLDVLCELDGATYIADLKTTKDASPESIQKSIATFGYHRQAAWYKLLMHLEGIDVKDFIFFFVETHAPYIVTPVILDIVAEETGMDELEHAVQLYIDCMTSNNWPGYTDSIAYIGLPGYYYKKTTR